MGTLKRVAVPSVSPGGLDAQQSSHFGRCDCFTVVDIDEDRLTPFVVVNPPHVQGGCLGPVNLLAEKGVNAIIVGGIGMRPLQGFRQAGIDVYIGHGETVKEVVESLLADKLRPMAEEETCGGH